MEVEEANCSQVKWVLPTAGSRSGKFQMLFGRFEFVPSKGRNKSFRRHISIMSTGMSNMWTVKVNEIDGVSGIGKTIVDRNESGDLHSIMSSIQDSLVYELISYLGE